MVQRFGQQYFRKEIETMKKEIIEEAKELPELTEEEVNIFCSCDTQLKIHCHHDCITQNAWISHDK